MIDETANWVYKLTNLAEWVSMIDFVDNHNKIHTM